MRQIGISDRKMYIRFASKTRRILEAEIAEIERGGAGP